MPGRSSCASQAASPPARARRFRRDAGGDGGAHRPQDRAEPHGAPLGAGQLASCARDTPPAPVAAARRRRSRSPGERMREREPRGVQELPSECRLGNAVDRVADDRQVDRREMDADLVHPPCLERDAQQRVIRPEPLDFEMRDRLARRVRVERDAGRIVAVAPDRRLDASRGASAAGRGRARGRFVRARGSRTSADSRSCASCDRATTISPEVSRSSRWTMPVRPGSPPPTTPASASTSVPLCVPRARVDDEAGRLVDDGEVLVLPDERRRARAAGAAARPPERGSRASRRPRAGSSSAAPARRRAHPLRPPAPPPHASRRARRESGRAAPPPRRPAPSAQLVDKESRNWHTAGTDTCAFRRYRQPRGRRGRLPTQGGGVADEGASWHRTRLKTTPRARSVVMSGALSGRRQGDASSAAGGCRRRRASRAGSRRRSR